MNFYNPNQNFTLIDNLPELQDLEKSEDVSFFKKGFNPSLSLDDKSYGLKSIPVELADKYQKVIRNNHNPPVESGMEPKYRSNIIDEVDNVIDNSVKMNNKVVYNNRFNRNNRINRNNVRYQEDEYNEYDEYDEYDEYSNNHKYKYNCIDIANHIKNCPICSKIYGTTDRMFYIVIIIFLLIICIILLKHILNK